ncbi:MAG: hypothetical protein J2P49_08695 [Methylocapsa sp.]|nr:hypothetical protein [Methylocapsa sp.]
MQLKQRRRGGDRHKPGAANLAAIIFCAASVVALQDAVAGGSPLDTIMSTHFFADVPEAKDFVRDSRPPQGTLDYQPVTGPGREGPKLKNKDELKALESELEKAAARNEEVARKRLGYKKPPAAKPAKGKANHAISSATR